MYDIFYLGKSCSYFKKLKEKNPLIKIVTTFAEAKKKSLTKFFWVIPSDVVILDSFNFDYTPDKWSQEYIHVFKNSNNWNGVALFPRKSNPTNTELETRTFNNQKQIDIVASNPKLYDVFQIDTYDEYLEAFKKSTTEMFWAISRHSKIIDNRILSISYESKKVHDREFKRSIHHTYLHKIGEKTYNNFVWLLTKQKEVSKREFEHKFLVNVKHHDTIASESRPYDKVFISYQEPTADENYAKILEKFPDCKRVHGIKGIHQAHIAAAKLCATPMFWIIDGDAQLVDDFNFEYLVYPEFFEYVHVWRSLNPINDLVYGYGGVKLFPRQLTINMDTSKPDMTTSITNKFKAMPDISNITAFNTSPFETWRSAFRECTKLSSKIIDRQKDDETNKRLHAWCTVGEDRPFGKYAIQGAKAGAVYGARNNGNIEALKKINNFDWLKEQFDGNF